MDCTEAVLGLTCMVDMVLGRRYDGRTHGHAGCRSSYPHRHRERGLDDQARARLASGGVQGSRTRRTSQPNLQHPYGLLPAMAASGRMLDGGAGCLRSKRVQGRPAGCRAAALYLLGARFACRPPGCYSRLSNTTGRWDLPEQHGSRVRHRRAWVWWSNVHYLIAMTVGCR